MRDLRRRTSRRIAAILAAGAVLCHLGLPRTAPAAEKQYDRVRADYVKSEKAEQDPRAQRYALLIGDTYRSEKRYDEALEAYERVFVDYPAVSTYWHEAQGHIVSVLRDKGDLAGALSAARIELDAASSGGVGNAIRMVASLLKAADKDEVERANAFILFQTYGPAGEDGKIGTADDPADPLAKIDYPSYPRREKAFAPVRARAGDDVTGSRYRALTCLYTGRPKEALRMYLDAFARGDTEEFARVGVELITVGVRAARGHPAGLEKFYDFVSYGPAGRDGKAGTADDLEDPFAELGLKQTDFAPQGPGGAAGLTDDDIRALREARTLLKEIVASRSELSDVRRAALVALMRIQRTLNDWAGQEGPDWYLERLFLRPGDGRYASTWLSAGQLAAKRGACHLGGVREFWRKVDSMASDPDSKMHRDVERLRSNFQRALRSFEEPKSLLPRGLKPLPPPRRR